VDLKLFKWQDAKSHFQKSFSSLIRVILGVPQWSNIDRRQYNELAQSLAFNLIVPIVLLVFMIRQVTYADDLGIYCNELMYTL